ncbi:MAG: response regulator transcription factor [Gammaproteobacteria bacterium]|nr:response regulator transcription factor [Gammaproteobacteria bacterium]
MFYGLALALGAFILQWLDNHYGLQLFSTEFYIFILAILFTLLGIWVGTRVSKKPSDVPFAKNRQAIETLGLSARELEVLEHLAQGESNLEIAEGLFVSPSTVKTHLVHLYQKLEVSRRTQAVKKAKSLKIIP